MTPDVEVWRKYLRRDPTRFLLDHEANPSVYLWYLVDIAHRPEDSAAVLEARERALFSSPVQQIFSVQREEGYWESASTPSRPYYRATLWNLAMLAELGIPRESRRARAACEFVLANYADVQGDFSGLNLIESGCLLHALAYFRSSKDDRISLAARALNERFGQVNSPEEIVTFLWGLADFCDDSDVSHNLKEAREHLLDSVANPSRELAPITFPPFDPRDPLFILRVLAIYNSAGDPRTSNLLERVLSRQSEQAHWPLEKSLNGSIIPTLESETEDSRWATLNALRVIVRLVGHGGKS